MPLNEIPKHFSSETRSLIEAALEDAWQELNKDHPVDALPARSRLRTTMVALAAVGETDHRKLKRFAIHAWRGALQAKQAATAAEIGGTRAAAQMLGCRRNSCKCSIIKTAPEAMKPGLKGRRS